MLLKVRITIISEDDSSLDDDARCLHATVKMKEDGEAETTDTSDRRPKTEDESD